MQKLDVIGAVDTKRRPVAVADLGAEKIVELSVAFFVRLVLRAGCLR